MLVFGFSSGVAANSQMVIQMISEDIKQAKDPKEKSTLHIYRARQYAKAKKYEEALDDYSTALELDHKGWIHLERSQFLLRMEKYDLAYEDAKAAKEEVPTLALEADRVIDEAVAVIRKQYEDENPETIILDTEVDQYRKTRFDIMRQQGVFSAKAARIASNTSRAKAQQKQGAGKAKAACSPRKKG
jgi:tetratricopeptide (TPR) repeat protein